MLELMAKLGWSGAIFPMNAQDSKKKKDKLMADDNYVAEIKFDGSRFLSIEGRLFSRVPSVTDGLPTERTANVPHLHKVLRQYPGLILDGEVYYPGKKSNHVTSIMGSSPEKAIARQEGEYGWIRYIVYDILMYDGNWITDLPWQERRAFLASAYARIDGDGLAEHIGLSRYSEGEKKQGLLDWVNENGGEGIMLKNRNEAYYPGARPTNVWFKVKQEITYDVVVMGYEEGKGKYLGQIGAVVFGLYKNDILTECGRTSGMTDVLRQDITDNQQLYIGRVMEIEAMERTEKGMFRHPRFVQFRLEQDKSPEMCLWELA